MSNNNTSCNISSNVEAINQNDLYAEVHQPENEEETQVNVSEKQDSRTELLFVIGFLVILYFIFRKNKRKVLF